MRFPKEKLKIGKYQVLQQLASGGMGEVFLALQEGPGGFLRKVVIKRMRSPIGDNPAFVEMFLNEARLAAMLSHPNVVHILELGQADDGSWFIAMEHIHGRSLRDVLVARSKRGAPGLPPELAARLCADILRGLHHAHEMRDAQGKRLEIIHRDVSPENILVSYSGTVKIVDFGIAKAVSEHSSITHVSQLKGKVPYLAPEQLRYQRLDARTDIYATGCLLYEVLCGDSAFPIHPEADPLEEVLTATPIPLHLRAPYVPEALEAITLKAMAKSPADRFASAQDMATALEDFLQESQIRVPPEQVGRFFTELFGASSAAPIPTPGVAPAAVSVKSPFPVVSRPVVKDEDYPAADEEEYTVENKDPPATAAVDVPDVEDRPTELMASTVMLPPPELSSEPKHTLQLPNPGHTSDPPAPRLLGPPPPVEPRRASMEVPNQKVEVPIKTAPVLDPSAPQAEAPSLPPEPATVQVPTEEVLARRSPRRWLPVTGAVVALGLLMALGAQTLWPREESSPPAVTEATAQVSPDPTAALPMPTAEDSVGKEQQPAPEPPPADTARATSTKDKQPGPSSRKGRVIVQVQPSAEVFNGSRKLGVASSSAPLELELAPGRYTLTLKNAELGVTRRIPVKVPARGKVVIKENLGRAAPKRP